jgi:hypothetical protein
MIGGPAASGIIRAGWSWPYISSSSGDFTGGRGREHDIVSLRRRQLRILRSMERDLADTDPGLDALYLGFARRTGGHDMRWVEKIDRRRRIFPRRSRRRRERNPGERIKNRTAGNWNDP